MEGGDGTDAFDFVDMSACLEKPLAEQRETRSVTEQDQALWLDEPDVPARDFGARVPLFVAHSSAGRMKTGKGRAVSLVGGHSDRREHPPRERPGIAADRLARRKILERRSVAQHHASTVAPRIGSDVPACLLSLPVRGEGAGDVLAPVELPEISGVPVLLINPRVMLSTAEVFAGWDGIDHGPLGDWRMGRNDLEAPAKALVPQIETVHAWLSVQPGAWFVRMSGSGATCFALFASEEARDSAADRVPREWWRLATHLR